MTESRTARASRKDVTPIGRRLRAERLRLDMSQQELGVAAGLDPTGAAVRINQYEQGVHTPNFAFVKQLSKVVGVDPCFFYAESDVLAQIVRGFLPPADRR